MKKLNIFSLLGLVVLMFATGCGKGDPIKGKIEGVWMTEWSENLGEGFGDMDIRETIAFMNEDDSDDKGRFRQVFLGSVEEEGGSEEVCYLVVVSGTWKVVETDGIELKYNTGDMETCVVERTVFKESKKAYQFMQGDWDGSISEVVSQIKGVYNTTPLAEKAERQVNTFFKNLFKKMSEDKATMLSVVIKGDNMECKVNPKFMFFLGRSQKYERLDVEVTTLNAVVVEEEDSPYVNYDWLSERAVTYADVSGKTSQELRIMRNYIFARHGYIFQSPDLAEYFSHYPWYEPRYNDVSYMLNNLENQNVAFIRGYE